MVILAPVCHIAGMIVKICTACTKGLQATRIQVEIDLTPALPSFVVVGLPDKAVQESRERIRSGIKQMGLEFPLGKLTVNLAPADLAKSGSAFDLAMAVGILRLIGAVKSDISSDSLFLGELSLDGHLRAVPGVLSVCLWAKNQGFSEVWIPKANSSEGSLVDGIRIYAVESLNQVVDHLNQTNRQSPLVPVDLDGLVSASRRQKSPDIEDLPPNDMAYVRGQTMAKRALEIAASGGHNVLLIGQPGSGKTLLARSYPTILPELTTAEILELTQIYSVCGLLSDGEIILDRPFRAPHHSASHVALVGGGVRLRAGEISLAHRGVLFLDEFPEFGRESIEALRQPLEDGIVTISRASGSVTYPSKFYLLAAANPSPGGYVHDDPKATTHTTQKAQRKYQAKFSGPIMDRIDLQVEVNRPEVGELESSDLAESSAEIAKRVQQARDIQTRRFQGMSIHTNSEMNLPLVRQHCQLQTPGKELLSKAVDTYKLTARGYIKLLKLSRTIADLDSSESIQVKHIAESLQYRGKLGV